jgi:hypothetical protein
LYAIIALLPRARKSGVRERAPTGLPLPIIYSSHTPPDAEYGYHGVGVFGCRILCPFSGKNQGHSTLLNHSNATL